MAAARSTAMPSVSKQELLLRNHAEVEKLLLYVLKADIVIIFK
jgi:hypothetical protein